MITTKEGKIIVKLDASATKKSACSLALKRTVLDGYSDFLPHNDTQYGSAFHEFQRVMALTKGNFGVALKQAQNIFNKPCTQREGKKYLTWLHLAKTCLDSYEEYSKSQSDFELFLGPEEPCKNHNVPIIKFKPEDNFGREDHSNCWECEGKERRQYPFVEVTFSNKVFDDGAVEVYLEGTIDRVGKIRNGVNCVRDFKTTAQWKIDKYLAQYDLSVQLMFYAYNLKLMAEAYPDSIIGSLAKTPLGFCVDGVFLSTTGTKFACSDMIVPKPEDYDEFAFLITEKVHRLVAMAKGEYIPKREGIANGACVDMVFGCKFCQVCAAPDDISRGHLLKKFKQRDYEPLCFHIEE